VLPGEIGSADTPAIPEAPTLAIAPDAVDAYWNDFLAGRREHATSLWSMYMFELWWQQYMA